ncbi:hypothetical protein QAD02_009113 [Eretmocerus hayati]|uniref:Uncharacterized protein n=1 Tax=Eretmocerus hayati TaxID=131215 RepID=A0ACC2N8D2_9HYME|nr:hypothetical protein QAD02_009113 [Eretmocerus hayati]
MDSVTNLLTYSIVTLLIASTKSVDHNPPPHKKTKLNHYYQIDHEENEIGFSDFSTDSESEGDEPWCLLPPELLEERPESECEEFCDEYEDYSTGICVNGICICLNMQTLNTLPDDPAASTHFLASSTPAIGELDNEVGDTAFASKMRIMITELGYTVRGISVPPHFCPLLSQHDELPLEYELR